MNSGSGQVLFPIRLNRYIALCGEASRRKAESLISEGAVTVDGEPELSQGRVLAGDERVCVKGRPITVAPPTYIIMNKPRGVLSAVSDAREKTVIDLLPESYRRRGLFPAGRLDKDSEGIIILTNDGKFAQSVIHPSSCVKKTYIVLLERMADKKQVIELSEGVIIDGKRAVPLEISYEGGDGRRLRIVLGEGFKREIRLMAEAVGSRVVRLKRTGIGGLFLKKMPPGSFREYNYSQIQGMISDGGEV
ncbi:MAG: rRNA pseudouridine synthase [Synergistaceae bacterium]|jgi:23S rRNA pseudouridine2605 synthase|nr:rRNA pseudouridine synthase [Synergistaceae bacterium]